MRSRWPVLAVAVAVLVAGSGGAPAGADSAPNDVLIPPPLVLGSDGTPSVAQPGASLAATVHQAPGSIAADCSREVSAEVNA